MRRIVIACLLLLTTTATWISGVESVSSIVIDNPDGVYKPGDQIFLTITFTGPVNKRAATTPTITFAGATSDLTIDFTAATGWGTSAIGFSFLVPAGFATDALDYKSTTALTSGPIVDDGTTTSSDTTLPQPVTGTGSLSLDRHVVIRGGSDSVAPVVLNITSTSDERVYLLGEHIAISLTFSERVGAFEFVPPAVPTTPVLVLNAHTAGAAIATYASGSGTDTLVFDYVVQTGDYTPDLDVLSVDFTAGGKISDGFNQMTSLAIPTLGVVKSLAANRNIRISTVPDSTAPVFQSITTTALSPATYVAGDTIAFDVKFSEAVAATGAPVLVLKSYGPHDALAALTSGSGTDTLTFTYVVAGDDVNGKLDYVSTSAIQLSGGATIGDVANTASIALPAPGATGSIGDQYALAINPPGHNGNGKPPPTVNAPVSGGGCGLGSAAGVLAGLALLLRGRRRA
jgi:hypothetical protein